MARTLLTRAATEAVQAAERTTRAQGRTSKAAAHFAAIPRHTDPKGQAVRARVATTPEEWAITAISCDVDRTVALLEHGTGLWCPVCGTRYDRIPGAGVGPVEVERAV